MTKPKLEDALKVFRRQSVEIAMRHMLGRAGIVDQDVQPAPAFRRGGDAAAILIARDVTLDDEDFRGPGLAAGLCGGFGVALAGRVIDDEPCAATGENAGGRRPEARGRSGHDRAYSVHCHPPRLLPF